MKKFCKRTVSLALVMVMLIGLMPMQVFATEATEVAEDAEILRQLAKETSFPFPSSYQYALTVCACWRVKLDLFT